MQLGAVFPTCEIGDDPAAIRDFAQAAEALGYTHLISYDHVLGAVHEGRTPPLMGPYTEREPFHEPFVLYGFLAAVTTRLRLHTGVIILPQRQTALVAKQAAELAVLSGGRFALGVGTGWNHVEYEALGMDFRTRGRRLNEQVELLRRLWSEPVVDFEGRDHRVDRAGILPRPPAPIPIWFGGFTPPAIRRAARLGDGFLFGAPTSPMQKLCAELRAELARHGRERGFQIDVVVDHAAGPDAWHRRAEAWKALGATHFSVGTMGAGLRGAQPHIDALRGFAEALRGV